MYDLWLNLKRAEALLKLKQARKWIGPSWLQITTVFSQTGFKLSSKTGSVKWDNGILLLKRAWILVLLKHPVMFGALQASIQVSSSCRWFELKKPYIAIQKDKIFARVSWSLKQRWHWWNVNQFQVHTNRTMFLICTQTSWRECSNKGWEPPLVEHHQTVPEIPWKER